MNRLLLMALGIGLLLAPALAGSAAAYGGQASATMSCSDNAATMTRTVIVTTQWAAVPDFGITSAYDVALETDDATPLASGTAQVSPPTKKGTVSITLSFSGTKPFGYVQWELYANTIAPEQAGQLNAANFPGCPYP